MASTEKSNSPKRRSPQRKKRKSNKRRNISHTVNIFLIAVSVMIVLTMVVIYRFSSNLLSNDYVYAGVHVMGENVSGLTEDGLVDFLNNNFDEDLNSMNITIKINDITKKFSFADLGVEYNIEEAAKKAFSVGRNGNTLQKIQEISATSKNNVSIDLVYTYDEEKLEAIANDIAAEAGVLSEDAVVNYSETTVTIRPGKKGVSIDKDDLTLQLKDALNNFESATIEVKLKTSDPDNLNPDKIFNTINKEPVDAFFTVVEHKTIEITEGIPGRTIDRERLESAIVELNSGKRSEVTIPIQTTNPNIKKSDIDGTFFKDTLGSAYTTFQVNTVNNRNRKENMVLACVPINNYILAPGDEFAFNAVVGQRTEAAGYKTAGAFSNGELIDDIGGGICQVSSTLYNAVLYADLGVSERRNHSFLVGYTIKGIDATVSYPQPEFKFKNTTDHPIKITCGVDGTKISFSIVGTRSGPVKEITLSGEVRETKPFNEVITEDPELAEGTRIVTQSGKTGYTIDTYKTVKVGNEPPQKIKIATNKYKTMDQLVTLGTKPEPSAEPTVILPEGSDDDYIGDPSDFPQTKPNNQNESTSNNQNQSGSNNNQNNTTQSTTRPDDSQSSKPDPTEPVHTRTPRPPRTPRPTAPSED